MHVVVSSVTATCDGCVFYQVQRAAMAYLVETDCLDHLAEWVPRVHLADLAGQERMVAR